MNKRNPRPNVVTGDDDTSNRVAIRRDAAGRYCLNDFHEAAGGSPKHDPSAYFGLAETQELIMVLREEQGATGIDPVVTSDSPDEFTFVSDEIAIDYTVWLSPQAKIAVYSGLRAQRELSIGGEADIRSTTEMLEEAMEQAQESSERAGRSKPH